MFFALWPDATLRASLVRHASALRTDAGGRLTRLEKLHMTLVFLGDVDRARILHLEAIARDVTTSAFDLHVDKTGYWPRQKIVWAAPQKIPAVLSQWISALEAALKAAAFRVEDRAWRPHMTLLREARAPGAVLPLALDWLVREFVLVESVAGAYRVIGRWGLAAI